MRFNRSYLIAAAVAVGVAAWLAGGDVVVGGSSDAAPGPTRAQIAAETPEKLMAVRIRESRAAPFRRAVVVRGRTAAERRVELRGEVAGRVSHLPLAKGSRVDTGVPLVRLDPDDRLAWLAQSEAQMRQRQIEYDAAKALAEKGFRPEVKLAEAVAQLDAAKAQVKRMQVEIDKLSIRAPFAGVIEDLPVEIGAYVKVGDPVAVLVDEDPFLVIGQIGERDVGALFVGQPGYAHLATGERVEGRLRFIATTADANTRTFRVELEVPNRDRKLRDGVTAELHLPVATQSAHQLSQAALTLNDKGVIGIRAVDADGRVVFHPTNLIGDGPNGFWLTGLPERLDVIVIGQEFVREGQKVATVRLD